MKQSLEKLKKKLIANRSAQQSGSGNKYWDSVIKVITDFFGKDDDQTFILTDGCLWEKNRQEGAYHPHAIEVVDLETGQVRYIKSGSRIRFVEGEITATRDQKTYNKHHGKTN